MTRKFAMTNIRTAIVAVATLATLTVSGIAYAQTPTPSPKPSEPSAATQVQTWTKKQWNTAQKEWAKDKKKWADCQNQSKSEKLSGRKSWSFLYDCMTG
jgi:hypothetical protein